MKNHTEVLIFHMAICAGASQISLDGRWDGLVNLDCGTLYVDGDYILHGNSILQMIQADDLLQVKGNIEN